MPAVPTVAAVIALPLAATLIEPLRRLALRYGMTDRPTGRKAHARPTPYLGGVAVAAATLLPILLLVERWSPLLTAIVVGGLAMGVLGLVDDLRPLRKTPRLLVEGGVAVAVAMSGVRLAIFGDTLLDSVVTAVWLVVITNSFNLLDNMDAAAGCSALGISGCLTGYAVAAGAAGHAALLAGLCGACTGFLCHNWPPARVFLGDAGSLFIGFTVAASTVSLASRARPVPAVTMLLLVMFVATLDTVLVVVSRQAAGYGWFTAGTDHMSHRLRRLGLRAHHVALTLLGCTAATALLGVLVAGEVVPAPPVLAGALLATVGAVWLLLKVPGYPGKEASVVSVKRGHDG